MALHPCLDLAEDQRDDPGCLLAEHRSAQHEPGSDQGESNMEVSHAMQASSGLFIPYAITE